MAYNLQPQSTAFKSGKNILASEHVQFIEVGITVAGGQGVLETGQALVRDTATGKFVKYTETTAGTFEPNREEPVVLNVDVDATTHDAIVGEVIVRGSVYDAKLIGVTDAFKAKTPLIRYI